jgi:uncharacterized membrane protein YdjX (TVP38/TMEM64 family)
MTQRTPFTKSEVVGVGIVGTLFLVAAYLSATYQATLEQYIGVYEGLGMLIYFVAAYTATILAPVSATPLIPIATALWGPFVSGLLSVTGWTLGAVTAFWLARRFGYRFVQRFATMRKVQYYTHILPTRNLFWGVVCMRLLLPVDLLSYALGLSSKMPLGSYTLATLLGITPFVFAFSYAADMPWWVQVAALLVAGITAYFGYQIIRSILVRQ